MPSANRISANPETLSVLLIEGDEVDSRFVQRELSEPRAEPGRYRLEAASALAPGLARLEGGGWDVLLLDLELPDCQGVETVERVRDSDSHTPIVIYTSVGDEISALEAFHAGARDYLVKGEVCGAELRRALLFAVARPRGEVPGTVAATPTCRRFVFGDFELDTGERRLRHRGRVVPLHQKPFRVLDFLIRHQDRVVSREELLAHVWRDVTVSECAVSSALKELRHALGDDGSQQRLIRTLRGVGYQFVGDVQKRQGPSAAAARSFCLAVLPFEDASDEPERERFRIGLADTLITELVSEPRLRLLSRVSAGCMSDGGPLGEGARRLGVDYVLSGSLSWTDGQVRVCAQLVDARADRHLWAEYYDCEWQDELELEARLARTIAERVNRRLGPGAADATPATHSSPTSQIRGPGKRRSNGSTHEDSRCAPGTSRRRVLP